ncbi:hypothetical protein P1P75_10940 [Streptomyces sp. ID05-39B]|uniref:hypothetical protein n=1 Tax=Streptomyces sp. ID05-39B TaxID=3028664 RepID=UPI0029B328FE|nr:hypothetical protein [Streptomyces sp. ID05-39B]MDX3526940.1 hypothetical protein [Streptomyces sp. ID05-39B]
MSGSDSDDSDGNPDGDATPGRRSLRERGSTGVRRAGRSAASAAARSRTSLRSNGFVGGMAVGLVFLLVSPLQSYVQEAGSPLVHTSAQVSWDPDMDGATWVFHRKLKPDQVRKIESLDFLDVDRADHMARSYGGVRVSESGFSLRIRLVLRGARGEPTLIEGMKAENLECVPAPTGGIVKHGLEGGGEIPSLAVDLDHGHHDAKALLKDGSLDDRPYFSQNFYELGKGESVVYEVRALTRRQCRWRLAVQVRSGDATGTVRVDDAGAPFLASSIASDRSGQNLGPYRTCLMSDNDTGYISEGIGCRR